MASELWYNKGRRLKRFVTFRYKSVTEEVAEGYIRKPENSRQSGGQNPF